MTCKEAQEHMAAFVDREIGLRDVGEFLEHISECEKCKDELETSFLVKEGLTRLEDGEVFDFDTELKNLIDAQQKRVHLYSLLKYMFFAAGVIFVLIILYFLF